MEIKHEDYYKRVSPIWIEPNGSHHFCQSHFSFALKILNELVYQEKLDSVNSELIYNTLLRWGFIRCGVAWKPVIEFSSRQMFFKNLDNNKKKLIKAIKEWERVDDVFLKYIWISFKEDDEFLGISAEDLIHLNKYTQIGNL